MAKPVSDAVRLTLTQPISMAHISTSTAKVEALSVTTWQRLSFVTCAINYSAKEQHQVFITRMTEIRNSFTT